MSGPELHEPSRKIVRVLIVDDHSSWRDGLRAMFDNTEFEVAGEADSCHTAAQVLKSIQPDLVLLDIRMRGGDGFETLSVWKEISPSVAIIMLSTYDNPTFAARAAAGGAQGYMMKGVSRQETLDQLRALVSAGTAEDKVGSVIWSRLYRNER